MKVILTHTYFIAEDPHEQQVMKPYPPLGLLYLSAYLKRDGIAVEVFDSTFSSYRELLAHLNERKPEVLGIHCNLLTKYTVLKLIRYCREQGIISILGGPDASTQVEEFLRYGADVVISGEGEEPLTAVLRAIAAGRGDFRADLRGIPNVSFRETGGSIIQNPRMPSRRQLDEYPFPDREAINLDQYLNAWEAHHGQRPVSLITARGCAFTCKWCSHSVYGYTHRRRKPQQVVAEIQEIVQRYRPTHLWYADDVFTVNKHWLRKFQQMMEQAGLHLPFECIARADRFDEEIAELLQSLGCYRVWMGAESGSQRILDAMSRGVTREQIAEATRLCQARGIQAGYFVMFGYPGEEMEDIYETIRFVSEQQPDIYLTTVAYPLRGTALYEEISGKVVYPQDWEHHLQRELDISGRFPRHVYQMAIRKLASDYALARRRNGQLSLKPLFHRWRSARCRRGLQKWQHLPAVELHPAADSGRPPRG